MVTTTLATVANDEQPVQHVTHLLPRSHVRLIASFTAKDVKALAITTVPLARAAQHAQVGGALGRVQQDRRTEAHSEDS